LTKSLVKTGAPANAVNGLKSPCRNEPGNWIGRNPVPGPLLNGRGKGVLKGFLGQVKIPQKPDQCSQNAAGLQAVNFFYLSFHTFDNTLAGFHFRFFALRNSISATALLHSLSEAAYNNVTGFSLNKDLMEASSCPFFLSSAKYLRLKSFHFVRSCVNHFLK